MLNVKLTPAYTLVSDDKALNFIVKERRTVDPTKAPGYKAVAGVEAPPMTEKYVDVAYYPVNSEGLRAALDYVRFKSAVAEDTARLSEFMAVLRAETQRITTSMSAAVGTWPEINVGNAQRDAFGASKSREISTDSAGGVLAEG
ncbi:hypothetical protein [Paenibacillus sp. FSL K6-2859]|uniref:hypothetical protein n=1 Tax=Paenibacillus sp. FSL K6-2859 TaxID=2921482 RepID=UPI0030F8AB01